MEVVAAELAAFRGNGLGRGRSVQRFAKTRVPAQRLGGEQVLPFERAAGLGKFSGEGISEPDPACAGIQVEPVEVLNGADLMMEAVGKASWQGNHAVLFAITISNGDLFALNVEIIDADSAALHDPHPGAVHQPVE